MSKAWKLKEMVRELIDKGASSVEDIHKNIADMPFDTLEKVLPLESTTKSVRKVHDNTVGGVYDIIRKVNSEVSRLAGEMLDKVEDIKDNEGENY